MDLKLLKIYPSDDYKVSELQSTKKIDKQKIVKYQIKGPRLPTFYLMMYYHTFSFRQSNALKKYDEYNPKSIQEKNLTQ